MADISVISVGAGDVVVATSEVTIGLVLEEMGIEVVANQIPEMVIGVGLQGPQGATGLKGDKGDQGDNLTYAGLSSEDKNELVGLLDTAVGETNYTNVFLNSLLG